MEHWLHMRFLKMTNIRLVLPGRMNGKLDMWMKNRVE